MKMSSTLEVVQRWCCWLALLSLFSLRLAPAFADSTPSSTHAPAGVAAVDSDSVNKGLQSVPVIPPPPSAISERWALVIGNAKYVTQPLTNPGNDAKDMRDALATLGWNAELLVDGDATQMRSAIATFLNRLRPGDKALFYFSGHGVQIDGENFLLPVSLRFDSQADVTQHAIKADDILKGMSSRGPGVNVVILDACRDNPLPAVTKSARRGLAEMDAQRGAPNSLIAYATAPGLTASDGKGRNGTYTGALLRQLRRDVFVMDALQDVRNDVRTTTGGRQTPWESSSLEERFRFTSYDEPVRVVAKAEGEYVVSARDSDLVLEVKTSAAASEIRHMALRLHADGSNEWPDLLRRWLADLDDAIHWMSKLEDKRESLPERPECTAERDRLILAAQRANDRRARFEATGARDAAKGAVQDPLPKECEGDIPWKTITVASAAGVAVVTAIVGTAYVSKASSKWQYAKKVCPEAPTCPAEISPETADALHDDAKQPADLATLFYTVAAVSVGGGLAAYFLWPGDHEPRPEQGLAAPSFDWVIAPGFAQLNARMRF